MIANNLLVSGSTTHLNPIKVTTGGQTTTDTMAFVSSAGASSRSGFGAIRTDTGLKTFFGTNVGGDRIGIYDDKNSKWILRADASGNITYTGGDVDGAVSMNAHLTIQETSPTTDHGITVKTSAKEGHFGIGKSSGNLGIWDQTKSKWIVYSDSDGDVVLNGTADTANQVYSTVSQGTASQAYAPILYTNTSKDASGNKAVAHNNDAFGIMMAGGNSATDGTAGEGYAILQLGNAKAANAAFNKRGRIRLYGKNQYYQDIYGAGALTNNFALFMPDNTGNGHIVGTSTTSGVGEASIPVYINSSGIATACKVNGNGSWHNSGVAYQAGAVLEIGQYIDFHNSTSTNDYDARISSSLTGLWISTKNAQVVGNENLRNIKAATTDLTAGSSALTTGVIYLVYE